MTIRVGAIYRARIGPGADEFSYVLTVAQQGDAFVCLRVALMLDTEEVLAVGPADLAELDLRPTDFTDEP